MPLPQQFRKKAKPKPLALPTLRQLVHWSEVCRFMDAHPLRAIAAPFPDDPPITYPLLKHMAQYKLVRHRNSDCQWQVAQNWHAILDRLSRGIVEAEHTKQRPQDATGQPFVVDHGVDTMYVNVLAEEVPYKFLSLCQQLKDKAQIDYLPGGVETPWLFGGYALSMLPNGKAASKRGGVSWGFILRNKYVEIRLRKKPISGIVAIVHFLAECLWLKGPEPSLDLMQRCLKTMWADPDAYKEVTFQLSQIHLCADIAHFPLALEQLPNLVTHSFKRTLHLPSQEDRDLDDSVFDEHTRVAYDEDDILFYGEPPEGWDDGEAEIADPYLDLDFDLYADEDDLDDEEEDDEESDDPVKASDEEETEEDTTTAKWDEDGSKVHWRGKHIEGFSFSPGGAMSAAWYDKILEERKSKKGWMRVIHEAGGWQPGMHLTRVEMRYNRPVLGALEVALGREKGQRWFDDPYVALLHEGSLWGFGVGLPPEHDHTPDVTHRGWMRLATPDPNDSRSTRWPTSPLWEVVQRVPFDQGTPKPLRKAKDAKPDHEHIDVEIRGLFITRAMLREDYLRAPATLAAELADFHQWARDYEQKKPGLNFTEEVRERVRMNGKKVPYKEPMEFPTRPRGRKPKSAQ